MEKNWLTVLIYVPSYSASLIASRAVGITWGENLILKWDVEAIGVAVGCDCRLIHPSLNSDCQS